jgi:hypothetical protein
MRRLWAALGCCAALLAAPPVATAADAVSYSEAQLRLLYDEAVGIGASTYTFYILGSKDEALMREQSRQLQDPAYRYRSLKTLMNMMPSKKPAYAIPALIREQLRQLAETERSGVFQLNQEGWLIAELESVNPGTPMPPFETLRKQLPGLVAEGALPTPERLASDPELLRRSLMNKVASARDFDRLPPGIDPDQILSSGYTLLQQAILRDDETLVADLLKRRANPNLCPMRACPLQLAARSEKHALVFTHQLLESGAQPDLVTAATGEDTALTLAARLGKLELVKRLLAAGADINGGPGGIPPLSIAVYRGHAEVVKHLLTSGADPLYSRTVGNATTATPMTVALNNEKPEMIALLRGVAVAKMGSKEQYQWSGWLEQDGQRLAPEQGIVRLKRKPFSVHARLQNGAALQVHAATGTRIFDEFKRKDLRTPLNQARRLALETRDGSAQWLIVSDDQGLQSAARASGVQAWTWTGRDRDFNRVDQTPQGDVYVRTINSVMLDNGKETRAAVPLEESGLREINIVMGTALSYDKTTAEFVNPLEFKLVFDR